MQAGSGKDKPGPGIPLGLAHDAQETGGEARSEKRTLRGGVRSLNISYFIHQLMHPMEIVGLYV
jgi:hypothetical protein